MNQLLKKKLVASLLFICCLAGAGLLLSASPAAEKRLQSFVQIDSLIVDTLGKFGVNRRQISSHKTEIDSLFQRKTFTATVTKKIPETKLHLALKHVFQPYNISLPARVLFPDKDLRIHFSFKNTVIRTLLIDVEEPDTALAGQTFITPETLATL